MKNRPHNPAMYFAFLRAAERNIIAASARGLHASRLTQRVVRALQYNAALASR